MRLEGMKAVLLVGISVLTGHLAWADATDPSTNVSTATATSLYDKISEKVNLTYFGVYRGASLTDPLNVLQPSLTGELDPTSPLSLESLVTAGYKINKDLMVGVVGHFFYYPIARPEIRVPNQPVAYQERFQNYDPSIVITRSNLINRDGFRLKGTIAAHLPLSSYDVLQREKLATAISPTFSMSYDVPRTDLTVGMFGYVRGYVPTAETGSGALSYKVYLAPNASYQLSKTVAATLWVDLVQVSRRTGTGFISGIRNAEMDIEPGISWDITKFITINPIINIYPSNLTLAATSFQAFIIGKAF